MKKISWIFIAIIAIAGCKNDETPYVVNAEGVELTVPGFVKEDELTEDGILEYANRYRNFYIVLVPGQVKDLDSFGIQSVSRITHVLKNVEIDTISQDSTQLIYEIKGNFTEEKEPIYYYLKIAKINNKNYSLAVWTRGKERKKKYQDTIYQILNSLKSSQTS